MYLAGTSVNKHPRVKESSHHRSAIISLYKFYKARCRTNGLKNACRKWGSPLWERIEPLNESVVMSCSGECVRNRWWGLWPWILDLRYEIRCVPNSCWNLAIADDEQTQLDDSARNEIGPSVNRNSTSFPLCKNYNSNGILSGFTTQPIHDNLRLSPKRPLPCASSLRWCQSLRFTVFSNS